MNTRGGASESFIPPHGGYAGLLAYQKALIVYQGTVRFCQRFLEKRDRTVDQMVQAARSGKQNIVEASQASGTSKETEIKLINVARASLEELLEDYRDFLRVRELRVWAKDSREALFVRKLGAEKERPYRTYIETRSPEVGGKYSHLLNPPNQLPARPIAAETRERVPAKRWPARTHDPSAAGRAGEAAKPLKQIGFLFPTRNFFRPL
jgi:four helix bundle protein